jgi:hypothetical protein
MGDRVIRSSNHAAVRFSAPTESLNEMLHTFNRYEGSSDTYYPWLPLNQSRPNGLPMLYCADAAENYLLSHLFYSMLRAKYFRPAKRGMSEHGRVRFSATVLLVTGFARCLGHAAEG